MFSLGNLLALLLQSIQALGKGIKTLGKGIAQAVVIAVTASLPSITSALSNLGSFARSAAASPYGPGPAISGIIGIFSSALAGLGSLIGQFLGPLVSSANSQVGTWLGNVWTLFTTRVVSPSFNFLNNFFSVAGGLTANLFGLIGGLAVSTATGVGSTVGKAVRGALGTVANLYRQGTGRTQAQAQVSQAMFAFRQAQAAQAIAPVNLAQARQAVFTTGQALRTSRMMGNPAQIATNQAAYRQAQAAMVQAQQAAYLAPQQTQAAGQNLQQALAMRAGSRGFGGALRGTAAVVGAVSRGVGTVTSGVAVGGLAGGLRAAGALAGAAGGPWGLAAQAALGMGAALVGAVVKLNEWGKQLHNSNMALAEFSGMMAQVQAKRMIQDMMLSQQKGNALAGSAMELSDSQAEFNQKWAKYEILFQGFANNTMSVFYKILGMGVDALDKLTKIQNTIAPQGNWVGQNTWIQDALDQWDNDFGKPSRFPAGMTPVP